MALIRVPQQTERDIEAWERDAQADPIVARSARHKRKVEQATEALRAFAAAGPCYAGVSWGKDSVCVAGLIAELQLPITLVWIRVEPVANPHCVLVRDEFLSRYPSLGYVEIQEWCERDPERGWLAKGTLERGFARAAKLFGESYVSGVRGEESAARKLRMRAHGISSSKTCAPIGWWSGADVFAYLHARDLPVHPAYAMSMGGAIKRERLRVASLGGSSERLSGIAYDGGKRGDGFGRLEMERRYYGWRLREIARMCGPGQLSGDTG